MKNKHTGYLIIAIGLIIGIIVYMFNQALAKIVNTSCLHGPACPMWGAISFQTNISIVLMTVIIGIGVYLVFFGEDTKVVTKVVKKTVNTEKPRKNYATEMKELNSEEKKVLQEIIDAEGTIFQSQLVEKLDYPKAKITRILDRLEGKGLVERRRRGMTNIVILKQ